MKLEQLAVIGNGMATSRLLDELIRRDSSSRYQITVFGDEPHPCYNRILLNNILSGDDISSITLKPESWYAERGIQLISGTPVARFSAGAKRLWTGDGREFYFDRAVFAVGSESRIPVRDGAFGSEGRLRDGVVAYRRAADCHKMREFARPGASAIVIGGGLLGLEAAKGLRDLGLSVTILHVFDGLMNRQLDRIGSQMLRHAVEELGIQVRTSVSTKSIFGKHKAEGVMLGDGEKLYADLVVFAAGVQPRLELARDSDIPTNAGIRVDDQMRTAIPGVYAVGECIEHRGQLYGTVGPVYEQCRVLADVLADTNPEAAYHGSRVYTRLKVVGLEVASMGATEPNHPEDEVIQIVEDSRRCYRKLIVRRDRLMGAVLVGDTSQAAALVRRFERADPLPTNRLDLFASDDRQCEADDGLLCRCAQVSEPTVRQAIREGCQTIRQLGEATGAGTGCGSCRGRMSAMLLELGQRRELAGTAPTLSSN